jgi:hypothetical protein
MEGKSCGRGEAEDRPRACTIEVGVMAAATDRFVAWCKQEQASIEQELELITSGKVRIGEDIGSGWIDNTDEAIERAKRRLSQLKELLTEEGKTTVIKPDAL